ncbi:MAG: 50S ribosomal protein L22 [Candidatus Hydrothermarchaeales archaeon]
MTKNRYSIELEDEVKIAKVYAGEMHISPKWAVEICREIRGKDLSRAEVFLRDLADMKRPLPVRRYKKGVAHRRGLEKAYAGRYPVKAATRMIKALGSARANAEYKGLDPERLYIKHISAQRGRVIRGFLPRAFGRATPHNETLTNLQIVLEER